MAKEQKDYLEETNVSYTNVSEKLRRGKPDDRKSPGYA
jgi:hypothetical protein